MSYVMVLELYTINDSLKEGSTIHRLKVEADNLGTVAERIEEWSVDGVTSCISALRTTLRGSGELPEGLDASDYVGALADKFPGEYYTSPRTGFASLELAYDEGLVANVLGALKLDKTEQVLQAYER